MVECSTATITPARKSVMQAIALPAKETPQESFFVQVDITQLRNLSVGKERTVRNPFQPVMLFVRDSSHVGNINALNNATMMNACAVTSWLNTNVNAAAQV